MQYCRLFILTPTDTTSEGNLFVKKTMSPSHIWTTPSTLQVPMEHNNNNNNNLYPENLIKNLRYP